MMAASASLRRQFPQRMDSIDLHAHYRPARAPGAGMAGNTAGSGHAGFTPVALGVRAPIPPPAETGGKVHNVTQSASENGS
jgi:hypothetical protein